MDLNHFYNNTNLRIYTKGEKKWIILSKYKYSRSYYNLAQNSFFLINSIKQFNIC